MKRILSALLCAAMLLVLLPLLPQTASAESITKFNIRLNEPVASYTPDFSPEFNTNAALHSNVTWQENSPGFSAKLNSSAEFKAGLGYKVDIWVRFDDGNSLATDSNGDLSAALTVNNKAISALKIHERNSQNQIVEVTITCEYDPLPGREISSVLVKGVPTPVAGNMPIYSFTLGNDTAYSYYHTAPITWWDTTTGKEISSGDTFVEGHKYELSIWLAANREGGCTFKLNSSGKPAVTATINSWSADSVTTAYEQDPREVIDIRYTFEPCKAAHTCAPKLVAEQKPTCLLSGFKAYYACSCGKNYEDAAGKKEITDMDGYGILAALGHKEGVWSYNGTHHYKKCTTCKEVIPGTNAAHSGGKATCVEKGKCAVCGFAYQPENENHTPDTKWTACGKLYHAKLCKLCGAHCTPEDHKPGAAATETTAQTCTVCDYIITPKKNHTHDLTRVPKTEATCTKGGNIEYYFCTGCNDCFKDAEGKNKIPSSDTVELAALGHTASETWATDQQYHWRTCQTCQTILEETKMVHEESNGKCTTCGYTVGSAAQPEATDPETEPQTTQPQDTTQPTQTVPPAQSTDTIGADQTSEGGLPWWAVLLIALACAGAGVVVTVFVIKKKSK